MGGNISVCDRAEGSRDVWRLRIATREAGGYSRRIEPTESNVTVRERAEGSRTGGEGDVSVCDRAEGSRACGGSIGWRRGWLVGVAAANRTN
ncbi:hypothetical protein N7530_012155 [Penicillium desertorum]|uniref:Uncharacterized protein n=1 Tax=Penicillium desertorum TaxID=1303715 RepID=A0A9X0BGA4_9EURO|nr:hypothetical protein N7530_012155 [Penicillium desertorum]